MNKFEGTNACHNGIFVKRVPKIQTKKTRCVLGYDSRERERESVKRRIKTFLRILCCFFLHLVQKI